jgi:hypothetical protein
MNVQDEMSDNEVLRAASESLSARPVASPPAVQAIMVRGSARRRRRRLSGVAGLSVAAASTALALGVTGVLGPAGRSPGPATIRTVAFTLVSNPNGTATLTINNAELLDPAALQNDLAHYRIRALVTSGSFCTSDPVPAGFSRVVSFYPATPGSRALTPGVHPHPTITFSPAAMPAGTELSFGIFQLGPGQQQATFELINTSSYTCTTVPPAALPANGGAQFRVGPAGS